ncbi:MAG: dihydropteroate synthase [Candidatus Saccharicenans sp.]
MIIIGNLINSGRKKIEEAFRQKKKEVIKQLAEAQKQAGCSYVNVFAGTMGEKEKECLTWAISLIQERLELPVSINSSRADVLSAALKIHRGQAVLNALSGKKEELEEILPLIAEFKPRVVITCLDDDGLPDRPARVVEIADKILNRLLGVMPDFSTEDIYLEPVIKPLALFPEAARLFLESVLLMRKEFPGFKIMANLENISYGLPKKKYLNHAFLSNIIGHGVEVIMADPLQPEFWPVVIISEFINNHPGAADRFYQWAKSSPRDD